MPRLRRFEDHRHVGARDTMVVYDCDDDAQLAELEQRVVDDHLLGRNLLQAFAPDTLPEAANRGFRALAKPKVVAGLRPPRSASE